jgi:hypothetical protein
MNFTKRQKMLSAVFLVGVGGLVVDRTILRPQGGPQAASARSAGEPSVTPGAGTPATEKKPGPVSMAERLSRLAGGQEANPQECRDPFTLPRCWSDPAGGSGERTPDAIRTFLLKHQLRAVVIKEGQYCALIDDGDRFLIPGQFIDGMRLVTVTPASAIFEREGKQAVLNLAVK